MALRSKLFFQPAPEPKLESCAAASPPANITVGARGEHVKRIQIALQVARLQVLRVGVPIAVDSAYGPLTGDAVRAYKKARGILAPGQAAADNIVGKRTIEHLDDDMAGLEGLSGFTSVTELGSPHDHAKCPKSAFPGEVFRDGRVHHTATPIQPRGIGRKINIFGEGETAYLGFEDFLTENVSSGKGRPLTTAIPRKVVSDICVRDSPLTENGKREIARIAQPGCRLTVASNAFTMIRLEPFLRSLGTLLERTVVPDTESTDRVGHIVIVVSMR